MALGFIVYLFLNILYFIVTRFGPFPRLKPRPFNTTDSRYFRNCGISAVAAYFGFLIFISAVFD